MEKSTKYYIYLIIGYIKYGIKWIYFTLLYWWIKYCFWFVKYSAKLNPDWYDAQIFDLYKEVRKKRAFKFKEKIVSLGKKNKHVKLLMIETETGTIEIKLQDI